MTREAPLLSFVLFDWAVCAAFTAQNSEYYCFHNVTQ